MNLCTCEMINWANWVVHKICDGCQTPKSIIENIETIFIGTLNQGYPLLQYEGAAPIRHLQATWGAAPDPTTWVGLGAPRGKER
jgi:hypothetical protein